MLDVIRDVIIGFLQAVVFIGAILGTIAIVGGAMVAVVGIIQVGVRTLWEGLTMKLERKNN